MGSVHIKIKSEKASTLLMSVIIMLFLVIVTTSLIIASSAHYKVATTYKNSAEGYYGNEIALQETLKNLDEELQRAEKDAQEYISRELYLKEDISGESGDVISKILALSKNNLYDIEEENDDYYPLGTTYHTFFHDRYKDIYANAINEAGYNDKMEAFTKQIFSELYYMLAYTYVHGNGELVKQGHSFSFSSGYSSGIYSPDFLYTITLPRETTSKALNAEVEITWTEFEIPEQTFHDTYFINPVYTNALTAGSHITFNNSEQVDIKGDISSWGDVKTGGGMNINIRGNGYITGDLVHSGSGTLTFKENVSGVKAKKHLFITDDEFNIDNMYRKDYYLSTGLTTSEYNLFNVSNLQEDQDFWFINKDSLGGNVYAHNIEANSSSNNTSTLQLNNAWIKNDLKLSGENNTIVVKELLLGLSSKGNGVDGNIDPTSSSTVINNAHQYNNSKIELNKFYIPGLTFLPFHNGKYYRTLESLTSNNPQIFTNLYDINSNKILDSEGNTVLTFEPGEIDIYEYSVGAQSFSYTLNDMYKKYINGTTGPIIWDEHITPKLGSVESNIFINQASTMHYGYAAGIVMGHIQNNTSATPVKTNSSYKSKYEEIDKLIEDVFANKTTRLGYKDGKNSINEYVKSSEYVTDTVYDAHIVKVATNGMNMDSLDANNKLLILNPTSTTATLNVDSNFTGIIYCNGNLVLEGSNTITGTVIATGEVTLKDGVNIEYKEAIIHKLITTSLDIKNFFSQVEYGTPYAYEKKVSTIGTFSNTKRFRINKWQYK